MSDGGETALSTLMSLNPGTSCPEALTPCVLKKIKVKFCFNLIDQTSHMAVK